MMGAYTISLKVRQVGGTEERYLVLFRGYSLGAPLRNPCVKKRGPDLARRQAKKNTEPRRV